jgi:hypothetical protein
MKKQQQQRTSLPSLHISSHSPGASRVTFSNSTAATNVSPYREEKKIVSKLEKFVCLFVCLHASLRDARPFYF